MRKMVYFCDVCGIEKKQTNHWFLVRIDNRGYHLSRWDEKIAKQKGTKHICGLAHVQTIQAEYAEGLMGMKTVDESLAGIEKLTYSEEVSG